MSNGDYFRKHWTKAYPEGCLNGISTTGLFVWCPVHAETKEVDMEPRTSNDDLTPLAEGWEWRRFRLIEDPEEPTKTKGEA